MSKKATHQGECQICGARQKLPGGLLSLHGYTRRWGFFSGICQGAGQAPFEISCSAITRVMENIEQTIAAVEARIAELENFDSAVNGEATANVRVYRGPSGYAWEVCPVVDVVRRQSGDFVWFSASIEVKGDRHPVQPIQTYGIGGTPFSTVRHWVHFLNGKFAEHLRKQNSSRREWIRWQQKRVAEWAPKPLHKLSK